MNISKLKINKHKIKEMIKKGILATASILSASFALYTTIPIAMADSSGILGTNSALGSPILNNDATVDNWNRWEMICWGVFLSNFCEPCIDSYVTAFQSGKQNSLGQEGSGGAGYNALVMGTGNDAVNNETIESFCNYAVTQQTSNAIKKVYVSYSTIEDGKLTHRALDTDDDKEEAKFCNLWFTSDGWTGSKVSDTTLKTQELISSKNIKNYDATNDSGNGTFKIENASLPTFWVQNPDGNFVKIFDFMDSWDIQVIANIFSAVNQDYNEQFNDNFISLYEKNEPLGMDIFGNIVINGDIVIIPASANQHITTESSINLINKYICNSYIHTRSDSEMTTRLRTDLNKSWYSFSDSDVATYPGGTNPVGTSGIGNVGVFYYDTDEIAQKLYTSTESGRNADVTANYGEILQNLFECEPYGDHQFTLKYSISGVEAENYRWWQYRAFNNGSCDDALKRTYNAAQLVANYVDNIPNEKILQDIVFPSGDRVPIFDTDPNKHTTHAVIIPVNAAVVESVGFMDIPAAVRSLANDPSYPDYLRSFYTYLYEIYEGKHSNVMTKQDLENLFSAITTVYDFEKAIVPSNAKFSINGSTIYPLWRYYDKASNKKFVYSGSKGGISFDTKFNAEAIDGGSIKTIDAEIDAGSGLALANVASFMVCPYTTRVIKAFPVSNMYRAIGTYISMADGTEFARYAPYAYMTYLDFYGVVNRTTQSSGTDAESAFSTDIYDPTSDILNVDPTTIYAAKSDDEIKNETLKLTFLMLDPETGQSYRNQMLYSNIRNFAFESYNRIVYGGKSDTYVGTASKSNSGFFYIAPYSDNFLTKPFMDHYVDIALILIAVCIVLLVVLGLLNGKKMSYYFFGILVIVNVIILVPSSGEIVPYIAATAAERMFENKLTFWTLSEGIENAQIESDASNKKGGMENLTADQAKQVQTIIRQLQSTYTDRSLMFKQDISQKLTQELGGVYDEIQSIESARWLLPLVMQQYSADKAKDREQFLYVSVANVWDDASNIYWYYYPEDAFSVTKETGTSQQFREGIVQDASGKYKYDNGPAVTHLNDETYNGGSYPLQAFADYRSYKSELHLDDDTSTSINYSNYCYSKADNDENNLVHLYEYLLFDASRQVPSRLNYFDNKYTNYQNADSWAGYIDKNSTIASDAWLTTNNPGDAQYNFRQTGFEFMADNYKRADAGTLKSGYGFYKNTESPFYYFFAVTKDQFEQDLSLAGVITYLQGAIQYVDKDYKPVDDNISDEDLQKGLKDGTILQVRNNFMYATNTDYKELPEIMRYYNNKSYQEMTGKTAGYTPYVRDVLDLSQMFNNCIPYLYQMTLVTGGFDGNSGILKDKKITDESDYYRGFNQSWAYRCNWAVKLMENPMYSKPTKVKTRDTDGKVIGEFTINNPMLPDCYETVAGRPMIFSEAQQHAYHLEDGDLSLVELKCIKVNKDTARLWTLLMNYASTNGLTKEVLFREMATEATTAFNSEFSSGGLTNNKYELLPRTVDLRHLSFDAVMKMLMLGVSKDSSYIYNSSMSKLIDDSSIGAVALLLIDAFLCVWVVPFIRILILAIIFYLGFISILRVLFASAQVKTRICVGQLSMYLWFTLYTLGYYSIFSFMMSVTSQDQVLDTNSIQTSAGNPVWVLIVVLLASLAYTGFMIAHIKLVVTNVADMGFSVVKETLGNLSSKFSDGISSLGSKLSGNSVTVSSVQNNSSTINNRRSDSSSTTNNTSGVSRIVNAKTGEDLLYVQQDSEEAKEKLDSFYSSSYSSGEATMDHGERVDEINNDIAKGDSLADETSDD